MADVLIGSSGVVEQNLKASWQFDAHYNWANMRAARGQSFDLAVITAAPGSMSAANCDPSYDEQLIQECINHLKCIRAQRVVLISTTAVLDAQSATYTESTTQFETDAAFGRHRRWLEEACRCMFPASLILRLPELFGPGLKSNFVFDALNPIPNVLTDDIFYKACFAASDVELVLLGLVFRRNEETELFECQREIAVGEVGENIANLLGRIGELAPSHTNPRTLLQFYPVQRLWNDIQLAIKADINIVHCVVEPASASKIHQTLVGRQHPGSVAPLRKENTRSQYAEVFGGKNGYFLSKEEVLLGLKKYSKKHRSKLN